MATEFYTVQVKSGEHQGRHRTYKTGDVFRTQFPLHKMFVNKFELIPNTPAPIEEGPDTIRTVLDAKEAKDQRAEGAYQLSQGPVPPAQMSPYGEYAPYDGDSGYVPETFNFAAAKNVTNQFKGAKALTLEVWNSAEGYAVSEAGAKVPMNLAPSVLPDRQAVKDFLDSMKSPDLPD